MICYKCKKDYEYSCSKYCNKCREYMKHYYEVNKEKRKQYREVNREKIKQYNIEHHKQYYQTNKDKIAEKNKQYRLDNKDKIAEHMKQYSEANKEKRKQYRENKKEKIKKYKNQYNKIRKQTNPLFKLICNVRHRVKRALEFKTKRTMDYVGCSTEFLSQYLEKQFNDKMNWSNMGSYWHIDHIIPIMYNKPNEKTIIRRLHWTNLQPLSKEDNLKKGNNFPSVEELIKHNNFSKQYTKMLINSYFKN